MDSHRRSQNKAAVNERERERENHHSVKSGKPEELRLEVLHTPKPYCGLQSEAPVEVVVRHHHHLHAGSERRLYTIGSVFEHQALGEGERENKAQLCWEPAERPTDLRVVRKRTSSG